MERTGPHALDMTTFRPKGRRRFRETTATMISRLSLRNAAAILLGSTAVVIIASLPSASLADPNQAIMAGVSGTQC